MAYPHERRNSVDVGRCALRLDARSPPGGLSLSPSPELIHRSGNPILATTAQGTPLDHQAHLLAVAQDCIHLCNLKNAA